MIGLPLGFVSPVILTGLIALPILYWLLRLTPPAPKRLTLPTLPLVRDLLPAEEVPARTPLWLLILRLLLAAAIILAMAGPIWNPRPAAVARSGPMLILIDGGWASAADWKIRIERALYLAGAAQAEGRPVAVKSLAESPTEILWSSGNAAQERLRALKPAPHTPDRAAHLAAIEAALTARKDAAVEWISDGVALKSDDDFGEKLATLAPERLNIHAEPLPQALALSGAANEPAAIVLRVLRAAPNGRDALVLRALDNRGRILGEANAKFAEAAREASARFELPLELRNDVTRIEISGEASAGAVSLLDSGDRRRRVGLVSGESGDTAQPLLSASYYVAKALAPYSDLRQPPRGTAEGLARVVEDGASVVVLTDVGTLSPQALERATEFVEKGGVLIRFASTQATAPTDDLVPVRLRRMGRTLGSTLSWDKPQKLAPFPANSPFLGLSASPDITVTRQLLAEPEAALASKAWALLEDGTPLVTGVKRGKGIVTLIHVPPDLQWSNLALSGLFVEMLRKLVMLSPSGVDAGEAEDQAGPRLTPLRTLDGFGAFQPPPVTAQAIVATRRLPADADHPPGFYGTAEALVAVNTLKADAQLMPLPYAGLSPRPLVEEKPIDLRPHLLLAAFLLFGVDALATLALGGALPALARRALPLLLLGLVAVPGLSPARAQTAPPAAAPETSIRPEDLRSALVTRLAYVLTGDRQVDETSRQGLASLTRAVSSRTAFEPGDPIGIDMTRDEVVFYPLLYWPIVANRPMPPPAAIQRLDAYMRNGGIVIFDTRDAFNLRGGREVTPEARRLREILSAVDVPELEPVRKEHVVTKTFYLLDNFVGRYANGQTWIEALPAEGQDVKKVPAQGGDRVSPLILTGNDLAAAWATDRNGQPRFSLVGSDPRQREMALRGGINLVIYAMTGNYKSDQVHVPALLERLGQ